MLLAKEVELACGANDDLREPVIEASARVSNSGRTRGLEVPRFPQAANGRRSTHRLENPAVQTRLAEFERDLQAQMLLQNYLNQQYYKAKIQEARDAPTVQILDPASPRWRELRRSGS